MKHSPTKNCAATHGPDNIIFESSDDLSVASDNSTSKKSLKSVLEGHKSKLEESKACQILKLQELQSQVRADAEKLKNINAELEGANAWLNSCNSKNTIVVSPSSANASKSGVQGQNSEEDFKSQMFPTHKIMSMEMIVENVKNSKMTILLIVLFIVVLIFGVAQNSRSLQHGTSSLCHNLEVPMEEYAKEVTEKITLLLEQAEKITTTTDQIFQEIISQNNNIGDGAKYCKEDEKVDREGLSSGYLPPMEVVEVNQIFNIAIYIRFGVFMIFLAAAFSLIFTAGLLLGASNNNNEVVSAIRRRIGVCCFMMVFSLLALCILGDPKYATSGPEVK